MKAVIYVLLDRDGNRMAIYHKCKLIILDLHVLTHIAYEIDVWKFESEMLQRSRLPHGQSALARAEARAGQDVQGVLGMDGHHANPGPHPLHGLCQLSQAVAPFTHPKARKQ